MLASVHHALAIHCGPVLMGQKPAALVSLPLGQLDEAVGILGAGTHSPCCRVLRHGTDTALVLVYQAALLGRVLAAPVPLASLRRLGYPVSGGLEAMVAGLAGRICSEETFPHEIGFFLGYPHPDVLGFMRHRGRNCKCSGMWKVYGDVSRAKALFTRYARCSAYLLACVRREGSLIPALEAAQVSTTLQ